MARLLDEKDRLTFTATATSAITTSFPFVKFNTDESDVVLCGAGELACGVALTTAAAGERISVAYFGIQRVQLGATIADQSFVQSDSAGLAVKAAVGHILGFMPVGGAVGEVRSVFLFRQPTGGTIVGAAVASAAAITPTGTTFHVTGTTSITSIVGTGARDGVEITIITDGSVTITDGATLILAGANISATAEDTHKFVWNATDAVWRLISTSAN